MHDGAPGASPRRLLVRPRPKLGKESAFACESEAARSWLTRVAFDNGYKTTQQLMRRMGQERRGRGVIERMPVEDPLAVALAEATMLSADSIVMLSNTGARLELGVHGARNKMSWALRGAAAPYRSMVCHACLSEDTVPFWRDHWRLAVTVTCYRHGPTLMDACPDCGTVFELVGKPDESFTHCRACGRSLVSFDPQPIASIALPVWLEKPVTQLQQHELPITVVHPRLWWDGVLVLLRVMVSPLRAGRLAAAAVPEEFCEVLGRLSRPAFGAHFERLSLTDRRTLLRLVDWLMQEWPERFVRTMLAAKIRAWDVSNIEGITCPLWLAQVVQDRLGNRQYVYTKEEALQAVQVLTGDGDYVSRLAIKRLLGVHESKSLRQVFPQKLQRLSERQLLEISQRLDAVIAGTPVAKSVQDSVLRNACTVAVAMWTGVSFSRLVGLPLSCGVAFRAEWSDVVNSDAAPSEQAALARIFCRWMSDYLDRGRAGLLRRFADPGALFVTAFGEAHGGNSIPALFARTLRECNVPDWDRGARLLAAMPVRDRPYARPETLHLRPLEDQPGKRRNRVRT